MKFYEKIKLMRTEKGWSQEQVAEKLNMSLNAYGCIERGETHPNLRRLEQIAKVFDIELEDLISDRSILNIGMDNSDFSYWYNQASSEQILELQHELEKYRLLLQERDKEINRLKQEHDKEVNYLKEEIELLRQKDKEMQNIIALLQKGL
jgi:transcriptional regulator with XRE-family HTH domain